MSPYREKSRIQSNIPPVTAKALLEHEKENDLFADRRRASLPASIAHYSWRCRTVIGAYPPVSPRCKKCETRSSRGLRLEYTLSGNIELPLSRHSVSVAIASPWRPTHRATKTRLRPPIAVLNHRNTFASAKPMVPARFNWTHLVPYTTACPVATPICPQSALNLPQSPASCFTV